MSVGFAYILAMIVADQKFDRGKARSPDVVACTVDFHRASSFADKKTVPTIIFNSRIAEKHLRPFFSWESEEVWILGLSSSKAVIQEKLLFRGTVDSCGIHPRDIFRFCCQVNASSFLLAHNHPMGAAEPSELDIEMTHRIYRLSILIEIPMIDHLVFSKSSYFSFSESHRLLFKGLRKASPR